MTTKKKSAPKMPEVREVPIGNVQENPDNPRTIRDENFHRLVQSIREFPDMLHYRPVVVVTVRKGTYRALGGNMRLRALGEAGIEVVPVMVADHWSEEQRREFVVKDNLGYGEWDFGQLRESWDVEQLKGWGLDIPEEKEPEEEGEVRFSEFLGEANNYVVLVFDNEVDWLNAQTHFNLKSVHAKRQNGKPWSKGIGRVVNGGEYLSKLKA